MGRRKGSLNKPKDETAPKKPRKAQAAPASSSPSSVATSDKKPLPSDIVGLIKALDELDSDKKDLGDSGKEWIDSLAETKGLDKKAFAMARSLWKLGQKDAGKLAITLPHLLSYIDDLGLAGIADTNRGLEINGEEASSDEWPDDREVAASHLSVVPSVESDAA
jgi:hypothetical protein